MKSHTGIRTGSRIFTAVNTAFLLLLSAACLLPLINILAVSFSSSTAASGGEVGLWPVDFSLSSYQYVAKRAAFWLSMRVSLLRCLLGVALNLVLCILCAYPLSKDNRRFRWRTLYAWFFFLTMLIGGGLIPWYMTIQRLNLLGTIWALVLPGAVPVFNVVVLLNFFRGVPNELEEAAIMDGASQWRIMTHIFVPVSLPALATICLFSLVSHWNSWFDGLILMDSPNMYPLQSYLQTVVIQRDFSLLGQADVAALSQISDRTVKSAQIFLAAMPMLAIYPFCQKFFIKGMVLGSVKG